MIEDHQAIHAVYCRLTNVQYPLTMSDHFRWSTWKAQGWITEDLKLVVKHIRWLISEGRRRHESFRLDNLIEPERFGKDLAEARALARKPRYAPGKAEVLRATKRPDEPEQAPAQSAEQVMRDSQAFTQFRQWRQENGL